MSRTTEIVKIANGDMSTQNNFHGELNMYLKKKGIFCRHIDEMNPGNCYTRIQI